MLCFFVQQIQFPIWAKCANFELGRPFRSTLWSTARTLGSVLSGMPGTLRKHRTRSVTGKNCETRTSDLAEIESRRFSSKPPLKTTISVSHHGGLFWGGLDTKLNT